MRAGHRASLRVGRAFCMLCPRSSLSSRTATARMPQVSAVRQQAKNPKKTKSVESSVVSLGRGEHLMCSDRIANARAASLRGWRRARAREARHNERLSDASSWRRARTKKASSYAPRPRDSRRSLLPPSGTIAPRRRRRRRPFTPRRRGFLFDAPRPRRLAESRSSLARVPADASPRGGLLPRRRADFVTDAAVPANPPPRRRRKCSPRASRATPPRVPTPPAVGVFVVVFVALVRFSFPLPPCTSRRASPCRSSRSSIFSTFGGVSSRSSQSSAFAPGGVATSSAASHALTSESRSVGAGGGCARGGVTSEPDGLKSARRERRGAGRTRPGRTRTLKWTDCSVPLLELRATRRPPRGAAPVRLRARRQRLIRAKFFQPRANLDEGRVLAFGASPRLPARSRRH